MLDKKILATRMHHASQRKYQLHTQLTHIQSHVEFKLLLGVSYHLDSLWQTKIFLLILTETMSALRLHNYRNGAMYCKELHPCWQY